MTDMLDLIAMFIGYAVMVVGAALATVEITWFMLDRLFKSLGLFTILMEAAAKILKDKRKGAK